MKNERCYQPNVLLLISTSTIEFSLCQPSSIISITKKRFSYFWRKIWTKVAKMSSFILVVKTQHEIITFRLDWMKWNVINDGDNIDYSSCRCLRLLKIEREGGDMGLYQYESTCSIHYDFYIPFYPFPKSL